MCKKGTVFLCMFFCVFEIMFMIIIRIVTNVYAFLIGILVSIILATICIYCFIKEKKNKEFFELSVVEFVLSIASTIIAVFLNNMIILHPEFSSSYINGVQYSNTSFIIGGFIAGMIGIVFRNKNNMIKYIVYFILYGSALSCLGLVESESWFSEIIEVWFLLAILISLCLFFCSIPQIRKCLTTRNNKDN